MSHYNLKKFILVRCFKSDHNQTILPFPFYARVKWGQTFVDADKLNIYENYKYNIESMIRMAKNKSIKLILSTVAYDQLVIPPFYSLSYGRYENFKKADPYKQIEKWIDKNTEDPFIEYAIGEFFYQHKNFYEAKRHLERAFVLDAQPHRANKITNNIVRKLAKQYEIPLAEVEAKASENSVGGILSLDLFNDHCHLNQRGQKILLDEFYEVIINRNYIF